MEVVEHPIERKKALLDILSIYDHPLIKNMKSAVARMNPHHPQGQENIRQLDKKIDAIVNLVQAIDEPHVIHEVASKHAPHKFLEAHALVEALDENPLRQRKKDIEQMFSYVDKSGIATAYGPAVASNLTELLIDLGHRARSDRLVLERIPKFREILETAPPNKTAYLLRHMLHGQLAQFGPTLVDAIYEEKDINKRVGQVSYLLKVARNLSESENPDELLKRKVRLKYGSKQLKDLILMGLSKKWARSAALRAIEREIKRRKRQ